MTAWEYYNSKWCKSGEISEGEFPAYSQRASAYIDRVTFGRAKDYSEEDSVLKCVCALCECFAKFDTEAVKAGIQSEEVDGYKVDFADGGKLAQMREAEAAEICVLYLPCELLYRGV